MNNYTRKTFVSIAVLGTLSFLIMMIKFPLLPGAAFLELDFSDIPALIGGILFGPLAVILIELIKNVLEFIITSSPVGLPVGEIANFLSGICYVLPIYYLFYWVKSVKGLIFPIIVGTSIMTITMSIFNYFFLLPFYIKLGGLPENTNIGALVTSAIIPFNLLKGAIVGGIFLILYAPLQGWMNKNQTPKQKKRLEKAKRKSLMHK